MADVKWWTCSTCGEKGFAATVDGRLRALNAHWYANHRTEDS